MELVTSTNIYYERRHGEFIDLEECMRQCAAAGFRKLDLGFAELTFGAPWFAAESWREEVHKYQALARELGLEFVQAHAAIYDFCNETDPQRERLFYRSIEAAGMLGIPWIVVHPSTGIRDGTLDSDTHRRNVAFFQACSEYARAQGTGLAIENMWGATSGGTRHYAIDAAEVLQLIEDIDCDNVRVCWDAEHGSVENLDQGQAIRLLGRYIVVTHISDETGTNNIHILPYLGRADWDEILGALADIGYSGTFNLEIQHYLPGVPAELVPAALQLAYQVGTYMVRRLAELKKEKIPEV